MYSEQQQIYWYSGLYLQPQHFQSLDLHHSHMLAQHRQRAQPWNFGVIQCEIHHEILVDFSLKIGQLRMILPSGYYLEFPGNCLIETYQFRDTWKQREKPLTLWLALRRFDPNHANVSKDTGSRWINHIDDEMMNDVYHNGPASAVPRIAYNVRILSEEEKETAVDCECLPLVRLRYENDRVILDPHFSPPAITLTGSPSLNNLLNGVYAELSSRAHKFEEYKRPEHMSQEGKNGEDMTLLLTMRSLNRTLPLLNHYCKTPDIHPWIIYGLLVQLAGDLSSFNDMCSFTGEWLDGGASLMPYDHYRLIDCFISLKSHLIALLNGLVLEDSTWIPLKPDEQGVYLGDLHLMQTQQPGTILLLLRSEKLDVWRNHAPDSTEFKIATREAITGLIQHALPGINARLENPSPRGVPNRKDSFYFSINQHEDLWKNVEKQQNVAFYWAGAPDDLQVQLVLMVPS
ncbi:type VI secretion system baseplate subunit TssK [Rahnella woolbedingensis]|uniref:Type VI secretion system baseplate subunit TssK n=1 Tax=Rahnella woolbedingensis TaxID=1510574 RepID=A0A419N326_9GAMM|nr:type VI secretion system baseplate subunit TssK [Rahnella woolbedingensis]RJT36259.1 type VI secretion system baseplate subunit TssK [Rahnella woolbedingensis]